MTEKTFETKLGVIHYWVNEWKEERITLLFLPGLTADHRLFDQQIAYFQDDYNIFAWDAPGHGASRPFSITYSLQDKADYLHAIIEKEHIKRPVVVGQSMGGYEGQALLQYYPGTLAGYVAIDSAPLQRRYMSRISIAMLKKTEPLYRPYSWEGLKRDGSKGCAFTHEGQAQMRMMMEEYDKDEYILLTCHGFRIVGLAIEKDLPYLIDCPAQLFCGDHDRAGVTKSYNKKWEKKGQMPMIWVSNAGHNSNVDNPETVNVGIAKFLQDKIMK